MITAIVQGVVGIYLAILNVEIFGRSLDNVTFKISLVLGSLILCYVVYRMLIAWVDRHKNILIPTLIGYAGYVSYLHFVAK